MQTISKEAQIETFKTQALLYGCTSIKDRIFLVSGEALLEDALLFQKEAKRDFLTDTLKIADINKETFYIQAPFYLEPLKDDTFLLDILTD